MENHVFFTWFSTLIFISIFCIGLPKFRRQFQLSLSNKAIFQTEQLTSSTPNTGKRAEFRGPTVIALQRSGTNAAAFVHLADATKPASRLLSEGRNILQENYRQHCLREYDELAEHSSASVTTLKLSQLKAI